MNKRAANRVEIRSMNRVISVNVGLPREVQWLGRTVRTAISKDPVAGRVFAGRLSLAGDGQADLAGHGVKLLTLDVIRHLMNRGNSPLQHCKFAAALD